MKPRIYYPQFWTYLARGVVEFRPMQWLEDPWEIYLNLISIRNCFDVYFESVSDHMHSLFLEAGNLSMCIFVDVQASIFLYACSVALRTNHCYNPLCIRDASVHPPNTCSWGMLVNYRNFSATNTVGFYVLSIFVFRHTSTKVQIPFQQLIYLTKSIDISSYRHPRAEPRVFILNLREFDFFSVWTILIIAWKSIGPTMYSYSTVYVWDKPLTRIVTYNL